MKMTKKQAMQDFRQMVLPYVREQFETDGKVDIIARREAWNNYTDGLRSGGMISNHQYDTWTNPF